MANPKELDKRRKSIRNIRKITRTMELIATARFKKAMDRAAAATAYTQRITQLVADLTKSGLEVSHPLLEQRDETHRAGLLILTSNKGYCGGFNGNLLRAGTARWEELNAEVPECRLEISGKKGIKGMRFRGMVPDQEFTHFEDKPSFDEVDVLASRYLDAFTIGKLDRLDVVYMKFHSVARQEVAIETLLPLGSLDDLSTEAAKFLGTHEGHLSLDGLTELTDSVAQGLANHKGELSLSGLTSLSTNAGVSLGTVNGGLTFHNLTELTDGAAEGLRRNSESLSFYSLETISDAVAVAFGRHQGRYVFLQGLKELSEAAAEGLVKHLGSLSLPDLSEFPDSVAEILRQHKSLA